MAQLQSHLTGNGDNPKSLVVVFLRGGADGLNIIAPLEDPGYYKARPRIAIKKIDAIPLNGFFGLNPILKDLAPAYREGMLAMVHAAGSEDATRSHFEAQDLMEHGGVVAGGWLGRFLRFRPNATSSALSAIALGRALPECLRGAPAATVLRSLDDFSLGNNSTTLQQQLARLYAAQPDQLGGAGRDTLDALERIKKLRATEYKPEHGVEYSFDEFSQGMKQIARLIKAHVGLEAVSINIDGWDSHLNQSAIMDPQMTRLANGLTAFYRDLGHRMQTTTVVVMTEFGRRLAENSAFGTDHGRGSVMFVMGGGVKGGRVLGKWPGLTDDVLEGPGDLPVTTNYRNVLAPILERHGASGGMKKIFPEFTVEPLALYS
jgi:uncharacterized protein (DUF1501 family)